MIRNLKFVICYLLIAHTAPSINAQSIDSLDLKIGQMLLLGMPTNAVDSAVLQEVKLGKVGALIYFEKNIPKTNSFAGFKKMSWM